MGSFTADVAVLAATAPTAATAATSASSVPFFLSVIPPSLAFDVVPPMRVPSPGRLLRLHEPVQRRVQRHRDIVLGRLANEGTGDEVDLGVSVCFDVFEHRGIVRSP